MSSIASIAEKIKGQKTLNDGSPQSKSDKKRKKKKLFLIIGIIAVIVIVVLAKFVFAGTEEKTINTATAAYGDISNTLTGSGTLAPKNMYNVTSLVKGKIIADYIEEGDQVKEGDLLYKIDSSSAQNSIEKGALSLEQAKLNYEIAQDNYAELVLKSTVSGVISGLTLKNGDKVSAGQTIATVTDTDNLIFTCYYTSALADKLYVGESAQVLLDDYHQYVSGKITYIATGNTIFNDNTLGREVEITVANPGAIPSGQTGVAIVNSMYSQEGGAFSSKSGETLTAAYSGDITQLNFKNGDKVQVGDIIAKISSTDADSSLRSQKINVKNAQLAMEDLYDQLEDYNITSTITGTVIQKTSKAGETLDNDTSTVMAVIADMSAMTFTINVDELDISQVEKGQTVSITADALSGETFSGTVTNVSKVGTSSNGVTSYPVEVTIAEYGDLLPGMNVNATIVVESRTNVLIIPSSALVRGNWVCVKDDGSTGTTSNDSADTGGTGTNAIGNTATDTTATGIGQTQKQGAFGAPNDAPAGFTYVQVVTGLSDDDKVEITSGLKEGDIVIVVEEVTTSVQGMIMMGGGMQGGGGGTPPGDGGGRRSETTTTTTTTK